MMLKRNLYPFLYSFLGILLSLIATSIWGIGLTHDSGIYVISAKLFASEGRLIDHMNNPLILYPPLYSLFLSLSCKFNINIYQWALYSNAFFWGTTIFATHLIVNKIITKNIFYHLTMVWIVFSTPLFMNSIFLWADVLFINFIILALFYLIKFYENRLTYELLLCAVFSILSFYQRYLGVTVMLGTGIYLLFFLNASFKKRFSYAFIYSSICIFSIIIWFLRNKYIAGESSVSYDPAIRSFFSNGIDALNFISAYFLPLSINIYFRILVFLLIIIGIGFAYKRSMIAIRQQSLILILFILSYLIFFTSVNSYIYICDFDDRYISPVYFSVVILFFKSIESISFDIKDKIKESYIVGFLTILTLYPLVRFSKNLNQWYSSGAGYHSEYWGNHPMIQWLDKHPLNGNIISDNPIPIILLNNITTFTPSSDPNIYKDEKTYLVLWNKQNKLGYININLSDYKSKFTFSSLAKYEDSELFELKRK